MFVESYGEDVLASPPKSGFNLLVWVVPPVGVLGALVLLVSVVAAMRRTTASNKEVTAQPSDGELEPYLSMVDQELGLLTTPETGQPEDADETDGGGFPWLNLARYVWR